MTEIVQMLHLEISAMISLQQYKLNQRGLCVALWDIEKY